MTRDLHDRETLDLIPQTKKRGRPRSGSAMSNAERQRKFRAEKVVTVTINRDDFSDLRDIITAARDKNLFGLLEKTDPAVFERIADQLTNAHIRQVEKN